MNEFFFRGTLMKIYRTFLLSIPLLFACAKKEPNKSLATDYLKEASAEAQAGNYQKALYLAEQAYKIHSTPQIAAFKATLLYQLKHFSESLKLFKKIIDDTKTPRQVRADVMNNYACTLLCLNRVEEAKNIWTSLTLDKDYLSPEVAWFNLGLLDFSDALRAQQADEQHKKLAAKTYFAQAGAKFKRAVEIACHYIDSYYYLALCQEQLQQYDLAKETLLVILSKYPDHDAATRLLERLDKEIEQQQVR